MSKALLLILLFTAVSRADEGDPSSVPETVTDEHATTQAEDMRRQLKDDTGLQAALAERILHSRIGDTISSQTDGDKKRAELLAWVKNDPNSAAEVALGLARDDACSI